MADGLLVYCVCVVSNDGEIVHIFSSAEKADAFSEACPDACILYDYLVDHPERMTDRHQ